MENKDIGKHDIQLKKNPKPTNKKKPHPQDLLAFNSKDIVILIIILSWKFKQNLDPTALGTTKAYGKSFCIKKEAYNTKKEDRKRS